MPPRGDLDEAVLLAMASWTTSGALAAEFVAAAGDGWLAAGRLQPPAINFKVAAANRDC